MLTSADFASLMKPHTTSLFDTFLTQKRSFLTKFLANGAQREDVSNTTYKWSDLQLSPKEWTSGGSTVLAATITSGGATLTVGTTVGLKAGQVLGVKTSLGIRKSYQVLVKSVTNGTTFVADLYGGTAADLVSGSKLFLVSNPKPENNKTFDDDSAKVGDLFTTYTQIFEASYGISQTALVGVETFTDINNIEYIMNQAMIDIERQFQNQSWFGYGKERTGGFNGSFKGIDALIAEYGGLVTSTSSALDKDMIADLIALIVASGGVGDTIACNVNVARKIVSFNTSGTNPVITQTSQVIGNVAMSFLSDIPLSNGLYYTIMIDETLADDELFILTSNYASLIPMQGRQLSTVDGTVTGQDGYTMIIRGEYTFELRGTKYAHAKIKGFTI